MSDDEFNSHMNGGGAGGGDKQSKKANKRLSVERIYQKKSQLEHILLRPDTYIGSVEPVTELMWVMDHDQEKMVQKRLTYVPGLYKIFDEILVNAADNKQRDPKMDCIKINIDKEKNVISIWNNGKGIPVVEHKEEKMFVPTMIFGHLLTSSNYNDEEEKVTGGRNGYGAKLCNIFSTKFTVETASRDEKKILKQTWMNNMGKTSDPKIVPMSGDDYTKITFSPDLAKFKMETLEDDIIQLMERRAYDVAASTRGVKVILNGERLKIKNFKDYAELYLKGKEDDAGNPVKIIYENVNARWEVALALSDNDFQQVSFVNSIATTKGGRHVDHVTDSIVKHITEVIKKKNKGGMQVKPSQIKNHMFIFVNCLIVNPTFDSQTKETMTLQVKNFGSKCNMTEKFLNMAAKTGIVESVLTWAKLKQQTQLQKTSGKKSSKLKGIPKLDDANDAGTKRSIECTLILTEGDSAKTLAVSGIGVVGRDKFGVFPLRGKLLNVREASHKQIMDNAEINAIIKILGLQHKKKYETIDDLKTLRYGKLMIMTDQDQDGSHIKGLLINFIHHFWPSLLRLPFLEEFITPIVKATKGNQEFSFYSLPEFEEWKKEKDNWHTYRIKYYKGLGTSSAKEAKEYFTDMIRHRIKFNYNGDDDDFSIQMAFAKKETDKRKEWLTNWMESCKRRSALGLPEEYLYGKGTRSINYSEFVNKELILFSNMDNERSIPCLVDGLKPGQRKVIFTCFKRNDKNEVKVAQLAGSVGEHSAYHHGEQSLMSTIINLAQNFVGSNNINLLMPNGQFGSRIQGGKDSASPRYIFTMLSPLAKVIYNPLDTPLLKNLFDDNQKIEPQWYIPIIPMILVNGADGIGTGWMTKIPNHNPREIVENIRRMIRGEEPLPMKPWYKGFKGIIENCGDSRFVIYGEVALLDEEKVEITELPVGKWTQDYKEGVLEPMMNPPNEKTQQLITDYKDYHTDSTVRYVVEMTQANLNKAEQEGLHKVFKLQTTISTSSMCLFDQDGCLRRFESSLQILREFFKLRLTYYGKRKAYLEQTLEAECLKLSNQARFVVEKCSNKLIIENKKKADMIKELIAKNYDPDPEKALKARLDKEAALEDQQEDEEAEERDKGASDYNYLLGMPMWNLTLEKKEELLRKRDEKMQELKVLQGKSPEDLWLFDLSLLSDLLDKTEEEEKQGAKAPTKAKGKGAGTSGKRKELNPDALPAINGRRITPSVDEELRKKVERLDAAKSRPPGEKGKRGRSKKEKEDEDDLDLLIAGSSKPLKERLGTSPEQIEKKLKTASKLKQTKLNFQKASPKKKKNAWESDEEGDKACFASDDDDEEVVVPRETTSRRAAASKVDFKAILDSDEESDMEVHNKNGAGDDYTMEGQIEISDTDSEFESAKPKAKLAPKPKPMPKSKKPTLESESSDEDIFDAKATKQSQPKPSSDQMFDSLLMSNDSENDNKNDSVFLVDTDEEKEKTKDPPKKRTLMPIASKPASKPGRKPGPKKRTKKDSDSDSDIFNSKKKPKKKIGSSSENEDISMDDSSEIIASRGATTGRARKEAKYIFSDDEDSD